MRGESAAAEQAIFENLRTATAEWEEQAAHTLTLDKAIEYVRTPPVKHTSNEWQSEYDRRTVSNMVYRMNCHISEDTEYDRAAKKNVPVAWHVSWSVYTNTPPGNRSARIAGQERKRYTDKAEAEKYLDGRVKAYAHLFTEISPPLPKEYVKNFSVNGKLLPCYTVQGEEKQQPEHIEARKEQDEPMNEPLNIRLSGRGKTPDGILLRLPATAEQLNAALTRIGARDGRQGLDYFITGFESPVAAVSRLSVENLQKAGMDELNFLAAALQSRDAGQIDKLNAAAEAMADKGDIRRLIELTQNTDVYDFHPDISDHLRLGEHTLEHSGLIQIPDEWTAAIDLEMLGKLAAEHEKGVFTDYGYIAPNGEEWKPVKEIPQEYRIAPKPTEPGREAKPAPERADMDAAAATSAAAPGKPAVSSVIPIALTADNPRDRLKEATAKLEAGIKGIFESEQYKTYLQTLSKFHNYSANNCLLIAMQCPTASYVAGFNDWRDKFKRPVKKGEKGMNIFAPAPFKAKKEVDRLDASGKPVIGKDGKRVKDEVEITVPAFKVVTVFDASQTDGEPLPHIGVNELSGSVDRYKEMFAALEKTSPVPVAFENITSGAKVYYQQPEKRIAVNEGMSELQNLKTLIHEIAHARLHAIDANIPIKDQNLPDRRTREVEAESIAYTVCARYGLDTSDYSFGYVATWSGEKQLDALKASLDTIRKEADAIIPEVDKHFTELQQAAERQPGFENRSEPATPENAPDNPGAPSDNVSAYLPQQGDTFTIYQLKDGDGTKDLRFESLAAVAAKGLAVDAANYGKTYTAPLDAAATLDKIHFTFNMDRPEDFKGHSLSVSDIVALNRDGKETAFYVDGKSFRELPDFLAPKEQAKTVDLAAVAGYMDKIRSDAMKADPDKKQGIAAFNTAIKRLEQSNGRIPDTQPQLKALIAHAAQSPDIAALRERMDTLHNEFTRHYATAVQMTIDTGSKAEPPAPAATVPQSGPAPAQKSPAQGENVAAIEAKVKAGETINLSDLSHAIKKDKAAQSAQQSQKAWDYAQGKDASAPAAPKKPSIRDDLRAGKEQLAAQKNAPAKTAARSKNAGLGD
jgi:antirestriction protein ArdC